MLDNSKIEIINSEEFELHYRHRINLYNKDKVFCLKKNFNFFK